jgi:hypothetical protein
LKEGRNDPDPRIRKSFQMATDKLEQSREGPAELARLQNKLAIAEDLRELKKRRESAKKE